MSKHNTITPRRTSVLQVIVVLLSLQGCATHNTNEKFVEATPNFTVPANTITLAYKEKDGTISLLTNDGVDGNYTTFAARNSEHFDDFSLKMKPVKEKITGSIWDAFSFILSPIAMPLLGVALMISGGGLGC